ncbi:MAG TPA: tetratricopeptide repeat protein [Candidatus Didemnitutus sp.]|nr:tetratricopeptide repeat protein [Candidatus Didemnitutus sp.]
MKLPVRLLLFCALGRALVAAETPSPLVSPSAASASQPSGRLVEEERARSALQSGFPATAATDFRELLGDETLPPEIRSRLQLELVSALLDQGDVRGAESALQAYEGPHTASYQLRAGLIAAYNRHWPQVKSALGASRLDDLSPGEKGWWYFLQAQLADSENDVDRRNRNYDEANKAAVSQLQRTRFQLGQELARLRVETPTEAQLATYRSNMERLQGTQPGYFALRFYAAALSALGRKPEALGVLQRQLAVMPAAERESADQIRLLIGMIAGESSADGRKALREILLKGLRPDTQRIALYLLARGTATPADRDQLRRDLDELIHGPTLHPIIEDLLLVHAQLALTDKQYNQAEEDAQRLLERFPGSSLKPAALGVRLAVAWELNRYRAAAGLGAQLRELLPPGRERAELGVLLAESFFRSGDYEDAADAYAAALHETPRTVPAGILIFQRVLSAIRAGKLDEAAHELDEATKNPELDPVNRWQSEWNLVREMQVQGRAQAALDRVEGLLRQGTQGVSPELRIRLQWLRAKLSFDNGAEEAATRQVDELLATLPAAKIDAALRGEVASTALLLKAQALLALGRDADGATLLDRLRAEYPKEKAAVYSYIVQAARETQRGDLARAQKTLTDMADNNRRSEFAPLALYEAAFNAESRGQDDHLREAYRLLDRLVKDYPNDDLVFYAQLKQGDLLRKLNDFGSARQFYENLINNYGQHPDVLLAQIALADTLFAQGTNSVVNFESAAAIYERLRDLPAAPVDLRVEAGFKWGYALAKRNQADKAATVYWSVAHDFLLDPALAAKLGAKGRWWISRTLLELGQLLEDGNRLDEAQRAYQLIIDNKLGGTAQATLKLARFRQLETRKP